MIRHQAVGAKLDAELDECLFERGLELREVVVVEEDLSPPGGAVQNVEWDVGWRDPWRSHVTLS